MSNYFKSPREMMEYLVNSGKITYKNWDENKYCFLNKDGYLVNELGNSCTPNPSLFDQCKPYQEPKKKKQITFYRSTFSGGKGYYFQGQWTTDNEPKHSYKVVKTETKTIEVDDET